MWKSNKYNSTDGLTPLLELFENENAFITHFFSSSRFFEPQMIKKQQLDIKKKIENGDKIPVRYSMKTKEYFHYKSDKTLNGISKKTFKNKKDAKDFAEQIELIHTATNLKVEIDKDGNYFVRKAIYDYAGFRVSQGAISDVKNSMISHIWANTDNPLFFTSLWNIVITPHYLAFILDKPDANSNLIKRLKAISKAVCYLLYKPDEIIENKYFNIQDFDMEMPFAKELIEKGYINFIRHFDNKGETIDSTDIVESLYNDSGDILGNKEFVFALIEKLKSANINFCELFVDRGKTKEICKLSYPIFVDITGDNLGQIKKKMQPVKSDVYYSKPFEFNNKRFLVCNDWKVKNKELIIDWLTGVIN